MPSVTRSLYALSLLLLLLPNSLPCAYAQQPVRAAHGMVASANALATQAGVDILKRGGNAVDSACAVGFVLAVTYPVAGNLGGGGFMLIRMANGKSVAIDYRETAPTRAHRTLYLDSAGNIIPDASLIGYRAAGVPGTVAGLALAQFPESRRVLLKNGHFYEQGDLFRQPELAATLRRLEERGPRDFYEGRTAALLVHDMQAHGGLISLSDLQRYRAIERKPLTGTYQGYHILTMPPPSSGGIALVEMLNILERTDLNHMGFNTPATDHLLIEAMRRAFADRSEFLGDPDFVKAPVQGLTAKAYADALRNTIEPDRATPSAQIGHGQPATYESPQTTHFSVVDAAGNAVSNTYTLNMGYGSGVLVKGAGFLLNDEMDDFTSKPGVPNGFGLIQGESNAIAPHKRPLSSMTPTILVKDGKLFLVIGSPGGPTIINTVLQVVLNIINHKMNLAQAIAAPRLHHQWLPDRVRAEAGAMPQELRDALIAMGYTLDPKAGQPEEHWGDAEGVMIEANTGLRLGASDPRSPEARALGY